MVRIVEPSQKANGGRLLYKTEILYMLD